MFEVELNEHYEDNFQYRNQERAKKEAQDRDEFRRNLKLQNLNRSSSFLSNKNDSP